jgi:hypothetical protein
MRLAALIGFALAAAPPSAQQVTLDAGFASSDYRAQAEIQSSVARLGLAVRF